jgi:DNA-binding MarR family transcriptional regulator
LSDHVGTGRHLSGDELRAWTGFLDAGRMINEVLAKHLVVDHGMSHRDYEVLVRIDGAGGRMRMSVLARQIVASAALISQTIERLEQRGMVERQPAASGDGRGIEAVLLPQGREGLALASADHAEIIRTLLHQRVGTEDLPTFGLAMSRVADHLRAHRRGEPCSDDQCPYVRYL